MDRLEWNDSEEMLQNLGSSRMKPKQSDKCQKIVVMFGNLEVYFQIETMIWKQLRHYLPCGDKI